MHTQNKRYLIVSFLSLGGVGLMAWLLNRHDITWAWLQGLRALAQYEAFHIVMHLAIFATVAILLGRLRPRWVLWAVVIGGTLFIEGSQLLANQTPLNDTQFRAAAYDLMVNLIGTIIGLMMLYRFQWLKGPFKTGTHPHTTGQDEV